MREVKLITNHGLVLLQILLGGGDETVPEIAAHLGIKEQVAYGVVRDLAREGFITKEKIGRSNRYRTNWDRGFSHESLPGMSIQDIVNWLAALAGAMTAARSRVLLHVAEHPDSTARQIAKDVSASETEVIFALRDLEKDGMISSRRKRGHFSVNADVFPERNRPLTIKEQVQLALSSNPRLPDSMEALRRSLS